MTRNPKWKPVNVSTTPRTLDELEQLASLISARTERRSPVSRSEVIARLAADALSRCEADPSWVPDVVGYDRGSLRWTGIHTCVAAGPNALRVVAREIGCGVLHVTDGARPVVRGVQIQALQTDDTEHPLAFARIDGATLAVIDGEPETEALVVLATFAAMFPGKRAAEGRRISGRTVRVRTAQSASHTTPAQSGRGTP